MAYPMEDAKTWNLHCTLPTFLFLFNQKWPHTTTSVISTFYYNPDSDTKLKPITTSTSFLSNPSQPHHPLCDSFSLRPATPLMVAQRDVGWSSRKCFGWCYLCLPLWFPLILVENCGSNYGRWTLKNEPESPSQGRFVSYRATSILWHYLFL